MRHSNYCAGVVSRFLDGSSGTILKPLGEVSIEVNLCHRKILFRGCPSRWGCSWEGWSLPRFTFGCIVYVSSWVKLWCVLRPTTHCVGPFG